ncbi:MAG: lysophospholipase [Zavarzinia sp.]|nr:lysophospholipase [Zavarzinia sp.]
MPTRSYPCIRVVCALLALLLAGCGATVTGLGPPLGPARLEDAASFTAQDGTMLPVMRWLPPPDVPPKAVVVALHGFNDYAHAFALPAPFWASRGIATYAYDQRGFGRSATARLWPGEDALVADAAAMIRLVARRHPGVPLYLLGESMGGAVAMRALARDAALPVRGVVLLAPAVWRAEDIPFPGEILLETFAFLMPWNPMTPPERLRIMPTDNRDELAAMSRDPLMIKGTRTDSVLGLVRLMEAAAATGVPRDRPVLLLYGLRDEVVRFPSMAPLAARGRRDNPRYREVWYDRGYHLLLRDRQGPRVWRDIAAWLMNPAGPLPGDALNRP